MKVLITGVAGFLGTHVAELFTNEGWKVSGIDNLTDYELNRAKFDIVKSRAHNLKFIKSLGVDFKPQDTRTYESDEIFDLIVHCAAQPAMTIAIEDPFYDFDNNVAGTVHMLEFARKNNTPFVNCSSIHVYGNSSNKGLVEMETRFYTKPEEINENTPILKGDVTPLHVSKRATELYTQTYAETYGMRTANFRFTGMYGERQFGGMDHGWVANFAIRTIMGREITIFGTDKQVRDILHAEDAARAFFDWFNHGKPGTYNIGGGVKNSISLNECLDLLREHTKKNQNIVYDGTRFGDLYYFVCDHNKANLDFGWEPKIGNYSGIVRLVKWIRENKEIL